MAQYDDLNDYNWLAGEVDFHETPQALALGALLIEKLHPKSLIDVGCSSGIYCKPYLEAGIEVLADEIIEIKTICECSKKATMNIRIDEHLLPMKQGDQVQIGGNESYVSVCRADWFRLTR